METSLAVIGIIVKGGSSVEMLNTVLHEYGDFIIGRMGIPYRDKKINVISIAVDAPAEVVEELSGRIRALPGVSVGTTSTGPFAES